MASLLRFTLLLLAICVLQAFAQKTPAEECAHGVHVIAIRGHGKEDEPYGLSTTTINNITDTIEGSDGVAVKYNSNREPVILAAIYGAHHAKRYIRKYVRSCPYTKIVIQGYSQGAIAAMTALCGGQYLNYTAVQPLESNWTTNIISVVTYGDETRNAMATYNEGTCTQNSPHPRPVWQCGTLTDKIKAWCDAADPDCCLGGTHPEAHFKYPQKYNSAVNEWVSSQWLATNNGYPPSYFPPMGSGYPPGSDIHIPNTSGESWTWWYNWFITWWDAHYGSTTT